MPDIDTQIESLVGEYSDAFKKLAESIILNPDDQSKWLDAQSLIQVPLKQAIKTLLIQSIDDALANQATPTASGKQADNLDEFIQEIIAPFSIHRKKYARPHGTVARRQFANRMKKRLLGAGVTDLATNSPEANKSVTNPQSQSSTKSEGE